MTRLADDLGRLPPRQVAAGASAVQLSTRGPAVLPADYRAPRCRTDAPASAVADLGVPRIHFGVAPASCSRHGHGRRRVMASIGGCRSTPPSTGSNRPGGAGQSRPDGRSLRRGTHRVAALDVVDSGRSAAGHIFNLGHGVLPETIPMCSGASSTWFTRLRSAGPTSAEPARQRPRGEADHGADPRRQGRVGSRGVPGPMTPDDDYRALNRASWDERAPAHAASPGYASTGSATTRRTSATSSASTCRGSATSPGCAACTCSATSAPTRSRSRRLGARMTGLDFSAAVAEQARAPGRARPAPTSTSSSPTCTTPSRCSAASGFDLVFTGIGALCWLPDIRRWAGVVAELLAPGGRLFIREGHPMLWALAERRADGLLAVELPVLRARRSRWSGTRPAPTSRPTSSSRTTSPTSGTTASARSSPRCSTPGLEITTLSSTTACRGRRCPARWSSCRTASGGWRTAVAAAAHLHARRDTPRVIAPRPSHPSWAGSPASTRPERNPRRLGRAMAGLPRMARRGHCGGRVGSIASPPRVERGFGHHHPNGGLAHVQTSAVDAAGDHCHSGTRHRHYSSRPASRPPTTSPTPSMTAGPA